MARIAIERAAPMEILMSSMPHYSRAEVVSGPSSSNIGDVVMYTTIGGQLVFISMTHGGEYRSPGEHRVVPLNPGDRYTITL